ncbi:Aldose 1-epimerase [Gluconacetobacter diazotrophicus PA1 5]|uniref:Aldose 1-epimerase family protein n=2 Tax=Gluconacetobacter diazotrophicus TaxID=33996 RepID=A0A7W4FCI9_GLUDI|nr:aldose 1-epimerase family protein [Gluconacetobacter diazotrophicus]ACI51684.1 Aldose 1-epimerase [Gluconacetobacter diazotrophicus PA1 5]MBB2155276.1 aldose 1-epimerase family protein [Gluconacetobacter diazotrophicus]TWB11028.1 galactose mutarotase-like enzyme [Gluconacetobacter diazotrophicus]CAP55155.1 putative Aldose 1-epimerase [Gluconacetobacter diazotrophicus PA1 5]
MTDHVFSSDRLSVRVAEHGAELQSLTDASGQERIWAGLPAWPRHSPVLFPIVGRLKDDTAWIDGRPFHMTQHGFARDRAFRWLDRKADGCALILTDDAESQAVFPFRFALTLEYRAEGDRLHVGYRLQNPDTGRTLPASLGAHPAFVWPQRAGVAKRDHVLEFDRPEPAPIRRIANGLLLPEHFASPIVGRTLHLSEDLFADDAIILDAPASNQVRFRAPDGTGLAMEWQGFRELGLWMKPGADFLCIEPWHGFATPVDFSGDFDTKPGLIHIPPGGEWRGSWSMTAEYASS